MKNIKYILIVLLGGLFTACEEVVDVDLSTAAPRLVVDGRIEWAKDTDGSEQVIKLTTTTGYYETEIPVVTGATVFVTNSTNTVFNFNEDVGTGNYICTDFIPVIGEEYQLTIQYDGETYTATETLFATPEITNIIQDDEGGFSGDDIEVRFFFQDNGAEDNYYLTRFDIETVAYPVYTAIDDEFFQGNEMFDFIEGEDFEAGQTVGITLWGTSERYNNYMGILIDVSEGDNSGPFQTIPVAARGNVVNQTNQKNYALGYFSLSEIETAEYVIQ